MKVPDMSLNSGRCDNSSGPGSISRNELRLIGDTLLDYFMPLGQRSILKCKYFIV